MTIIMDACAINVLLALALALALASVINYACKLPLSLGHHLLMTLVTIYDRNLFIIQACVVSYEGKKVYYTGTHV